MAFAEGTQGQQAVAAGTAASTAGQAEEPGWLDPDPWEVGREGRGKSHLCFFGFMEALEKPAPVGDWVVPVLPRPRVFSAPSEALPSCCHSSGTLGSKGAFRQQSRSLT